VLDPEEGFNTSLVQNRGLMYYHQVLNPNPALRSTVSSPCLVAIIPAGLTALPRRHHAADLRREPSPVGYHKLLAPAHTAPSTTALPHGGSVIGIPIASRREGREREVGIGGGLGTGGRGACGRVHSQSIFERGFYNTYIHEHIDRPPIHHHASLLKLSTKQVSVSGLGDLPYNIKGTGACGRVHSQSTFATFKSNSDGTVTVSVIKQKIQVQVCVVCV
jgi:hypothetical protein